jgi:hypothetical protein
MNRFAEKLKREESASAFRQQDSAKSFALQWVKKFPAVVTQIDSSAILLFPHLSESFP